LRHNSLATAVTQLLIDFQKSQSSLLAEAAGGGGPPALGEGRAIRRVVLDCHAAKRRLAMTK
jgi:hypothetical protein